MKIELLKLILAGAFAEPLKWLWTHAKELVILAGLAWVLFVVLPRQMRQMDETTAILDLSTIQLLVLGGVKFVAAILLGWGTGMRLLFRSFARYAESGALSKDFESGECLDKVYSTAFLAVLCVGGALWAINSCF
jgi:hypothetical protein